MNEKEKKHVSKFLSLVLRHQPDTISLRLDEQGWANVAELIQQCALHGVMFTPDELEDIVATNNKQRFAFDASHSCIRASQGHSITIDLALTPATPPDRLYHGTGVQSLAAIREIGLQKMERQHVHLSADTGTAQQVGRRKGASVILTIAARLFHENGAVFYLSANNVWLTDHVPPQYIEFD